MYIYLLKIISLLICISNIASCSENFGCVVLCGGGSIPQKALEKLQEKRLGDGRFLVVSCEKPREGRWETLDPIFALPEQVKDFPIDSICGLIIEGGDQWLYLNRLPADYIQKAHEHGIPILGTSAGAMVLSTNVFTAKFGTVSSEDALNGKNLDFQINISGLKSLKNIIIDTHFSERNRLERLKVFVKKTNSKFGIGLDEETSLILYNNDTYEVCGNGNVTILNKNCNQTILKKGIIVSYNH
jgi:Peptidase family S51